MSDETTSNTTREMDAVMKRIHAEEGLFKDMYQIVLKYLNPTLSVSREMQEKNRQQAKDETYILLKARLGEEFANEFIQVFNIKISSGVS